MIERNFVSTDESTDNRNFKMVLCKLDVQLKPGFLTLGFFDNCICKNQSFMHI